MPKARTRYHAYSTVEYCGFAHGQLHSLMVVYSACPKLLLTVLKRAQEALGALPFSQDQF
jgi:hypothetical protein